MKHIISVLLENEPGALSRVVGLFSARGYNIETLTVAPTEDRSLSRMTIVSVGSDDVIEQITKHLNRLIEVVKVVDLTEGAHIERELMLMKVRAVGKEREEMKRMADIFPWPHYRRHGKDLHHRADWRQQQTRCFYRRPRCRGYSGNRAYRRFGNRPGRADPEGLRSRVFVSHLIGLLAALRQTIADRPINEFMRRKTT